MKLLAVTSLVFLAAVSLAQNVMIEFPPAGGNVVAGLLFAVQLDRPGRGDGIAELGISIGLASCVAVPCQPPTKDIGLLLYHGPYNPVVRSADKPPYQSFSLAIPVNFAKGLAQLNILRNATLPPKSLPFQQAVAQQLHVF